MTVQNDPADLLYFASDYMEGAHPAVLDRLVAANMEHNMGYGEDTHTARARDLIRAACQAPQAEVRMLMGGTQVNATVIDMLLAPWQGVVSPSTGHINVHEAGAVEASGHKVIAIPAQEPSGKIDAAQVDEVACAWERDANREHEVMPGLVYITQPTERGTLYSLAELEAMHVVCKRHGMRLYVDGARLAYALAAPGNDVTLPDLARLSDAFYIGGTKCGALFGEALVFPQADTVSHLLTLIKRHGALLAKGFVAGVQFEALFEDGLYDRIGQTAIQAADRIRRALSAQGETLCFGSPTNQSFVLMDNARAEALAKRVVFDAWDKPDADHTIVRLCTSWATRMDDVEALLALVRR